jgi:YD repeat-containing protein
VEGDEGLEPQPFERVPEDPVTVPGAEVSEPALPPVTTTSSDPRPRALLVLAAVVVLIAVIGVVVYAVKGNGPDPNGDLERAVAHSVGAKTADVALSVSVGAAGLHESIEGNGTTNFLTNASNMTLTYDAQGRSIVERAIVDGSTGYFNVGPIVGEVAPGKSWLSVSVSSGSPSGPNGIAGGGLFSDPNAMVGLLRTTGTTVTMLGSSVVDGVPVQGYAIHLSPAGIAKVLRSSQVPASVRAELAQVHFDRLDYAVDIDGANHLKVVRVTGRFGAGGLVGTVTSAMHFSDYGIPVHVSPPPADEVIPLQQFERLQAQAQGPANT